MHSVTSGAVYSAIRAFFNQTNETIIKSNNLNTVEYPLVSYTPNTSNIPTNYGVCYTFGYYIYSTNGGTSRWYFQLAFGTDTNDRVYFRTATNPESNNTTPENWTAWKRFAFV